MHKLELAYTMYAKTKYKEEFPRGPFLEGRFRAKILEDERDVARCMSYVCYNAIKHELVKDIRDWQWTSYHQLIDQDKREKRKDKNEGIFDLPSVTLLDDVTLGEYVDIDEEGNESGNESGL